MATKEDIIMTANSVFESYDTDNSGFIDRSEMKTVVTTLFKKINDKTICTDTRLNKLFTNVDKNSDNKLGKKEFQQLVALFLDPTQPEPEA